MQNLNKARRLRIALVPDPQLGSTCCSVQMEVFLTNVALKDLEQVEANVLVLWSFKSNLFPILRHQIVDSKP